MAGVHAAEAGDESTMMELEESKAAAKKRFRPVVVDRSPDGTIVVAL
ncbi:MAG: hypothetical protein RJS97_10090 [Parvibaculaceae bacterium]